MHDRDVPHFTFDNEAESCGQIAVQKHAIDITGMVGHDNAAIRRQVFISAYRDLDSSEHEHHSARPAHHLLSPVLSWDDQGHNQGKQAGEPKTQPSPETPEKISDVCDPVHFMLMPFGFCDSDHACYREASSYS